MKYLVEEHEYDPFKGIRTILHHAIVEIDEFECDGTYPLEFCARDAFDLVQEKKPGGFYMAASDLVEVEPEYMWGCGEGAWAYEVRRLIES